MPTPSKPVPTIGEPNTAADPKIHDLLTELVGILTGGVDRNNLTDGEVLKAKLGADALNAFVKTIGAVDLKLDIGTNTITFDAPGPTQTSQQKTIAHGLGRPPVAIAAVITDGSADQFVTFHARGPHTNTQFFLSGYRVNGPIVATLGIGWVAIG